MGLERTLRLSGLLALSAVLVVVAAILFVERPTSQLRINDINSPDCPGPRYNGINFRGRLWFPEGTPTWDRGITHVSGTLKLVASSRAVFVADVGGQETFAPVSPKDVRYALCPLS